MVAPLSVWPLENLGTFKYVLFGPLVAKVVSSRLWESTRENKKDVWCLHILIICALRCLIHQLWYSSGNMLFLSRNRLIVQKGVDFKQIDKEWNWDNGIILQALIASVACYSFPSFLSSLPSWNSRGYICVILLHMLIVEPIYYCIHRCLHSNYLFTRYHSLHHDSAVPQSFTAGHATPMEHLMLSALIAIPIVGATVLGLGSISMIYSYVLVFDFLRCMGHGNVEVVPRLIFDFFPFLRYLIYTPTYHSLHHAEKDKNFCLFMPLYDILGNTLNNESWEMHRKNLCSGKNGRIPDFVFLAHVVDFTAALHVPFVFRSFSSKPFTNSIFVLPLLPGAFLAMLIMWTSSKTFLISFYNLRGRLFQTWAVPRFGFQYFLPFARDGINHHIEEAILRADKLGIKVLSLAALNKNEALNGGGLLFVKKHPNLKVRVVHGNTLTAAVIVNEISEDVREVFLTGATSKLGRAIALYLCRRGVRVLMLTQSEERFKAIQEEAPGECRSFLVQVRKYRAAQGCKTWIVGKWVTPREQRWAAPGTHFHQFVVPSIFSCRRDCTYSSLAAMKLPEDVEGLGACEYTMGRGVVHACHAGGVVHLLEGWTHHEVGAIDVDKIDVVWEAALRHGLRPVS